MTEKQIEKARKREILNALKKQEQEQQAHRSEQEKRHNKANNCVKAEEIERKINDYVEKTRSQRKIDPEFADKVNEKVAMMIQAQDSLAQKQVLGEGDSILLEEFELLYQADMDAAETNKQTIPYITKKQCKELHNQKQMHDVNLELAMKASLDTSSIYGGGRATISDRALQLAKAKIDFADRKAEADQYDD